MASENLKKVILLVTKTIKDGEEAFKDGFQFTDIFTFIPELSTIPDIIKSKQAILDELKALTSADLADLATFIETNLVLDNKKTEQVIEAGVEVLVSIFNLVNKVKADPGPALILPKAKPAVHDVSASGI